MGCTTLDKKTKLKNRAIGILVFIFWISLWEIISLAVGLELLVPSPGKVLSVWLTLAGRSDFWISALLSLLRVVVGFVAGTFVGIAMACASHALPALKRVMAPFVKVVRTVPVASVIILALVWVKTDALPSLISAAMAFPIIWQNLTDSFDGGSTRELREMAQLYNMGKLKTFFGIIFPAAVPTLISGMVNALGFAWKSGIAAEVICQPAFSIGKRLQSAKNYLETPEVFAWTVTVCIMSVALERLLKFITYRLKKSNLV